MRPTTRPHRSSPRATNPPETWQNGYIMKIIVVVASIALFLASFPLFAYSFAAPDEFKAIIFFTGIMSISLSLAIPFHILGSRE